jgi:hypothetical protein
MISTFSYLNATNKTNNTMPRLVICLGILLIGLTLMAQQPLSHPKKMYVSPEGKLYVQRDLPVYLWLSTSPSENSEKTGCGARLQKPIQIQCILMQMGIIPFVPFSCGYRYQKGYLANEGYVF